MKNLISKIRPIAKIIGIVLGIFILWIIFGLLTNKQSVDYGIQKETLNTPMLETNRANISMDAMDTNMKMMEDSMPAYSGNLNQASSPEAVSSDKKVIKNGNLTLKVENTENSAQKISEIIKNQNGEIFSTNFFERVKGQKSGSLTVKIPVDKFEATLALIKTVATQVVSESTTGQDITEQYSDLQAQLKNKRAEEQSFVKILDRAGDIDDVLAVTKQIARVRGEIERLEGRIKFMDSQTNMSTIVIALSEDIEIAPVQNDWRPWQITKKAFSDLLNNSQDFVDGTIRFIIVSIPSLIPFLIFLWVIYWISKKIWRKIKS
ncbi:MAG: DUF4349 domain-containing protein [Candidatus Moranbacteria bacterium]|nr:DUF4349 domain-containing protein [Candidatus Moranbacteria bacterium]